MHFNFYCKHQKRNKYHYGNIPAKACRDKQWFAIKRNEENDLFPIVNIRISGIRSIDVRELTNLWCNDYCDPTLVPQEATVSYLIKDNSDGGARPPRPVVSDPNGCGGFTWLLLPHKTAPLKRLKSIAKSAFLPARSPSAAGYATRRRGRWQRCAGGSCSSSDHWTWGSSGRSLRGRAAPISFQSVSDLADVTYQKENDLFSWTGASPLQFAKYTRTPTFWQSVQIWEKRKKSQWIKRPKMNQQGNPQCWDETWVKSLAPATSTNITLLQSSKTAWISDSTVSGRKERKDLFNIAFFLNNQDKHSDGNNFVAYQI